MKSVTDKNPQKGEIMDILWISGCLAFFVLSACLIRLFVHQQAEL